MGDGPTQAGAQKGIALADGPSWSSGDRLMPQSMMKGMSVPTSIPTAPGTKVIAPDAAPMPKVASQTPSIPQSPLLNQDINFQHSGDIGQPIQSGDTTVYSPQGNAGIGLQNSQVPTSQAPIVGQTGQFQSGAQAVQNPDQSTMTQGSNPVSFANASKIESLLPQVQSGQSGAPASNATPNTAQSPSQPNPSMNAVQANDKALTDVMNNLEGPELSNEPHGRKSRYGIGAVGNETVPKDLNDAKQQYNQYYIDNNPQRQAIVNQLTDPRDLYAYHQGLLIQSGNTDKFTDNWDGPVGGDAWRNALYNNQAANLNRLAQKPAFAQNADGWNKRTKRARNYNPSGDNT